MILILQLIYLASSKLLESHLYVASNYIISYYRLIIDILKYIFLLYIIYILTKYIVLDSIVALAKQSLAIFYKIYIFIMAKVEKFLNFFYRIAKASR